MQAAMRGLPLATKPAAPRPVNTTSATRTSKAPCRAIQAAFCPLPSFITSDKNLTLIRYPIPVPTDQLPSAEPLI